MENHEQQGDSLTEAAIQAEDEQSSQKLWQDAADKYSSALSEVQILGSIEGIRLHRKLAFCHRKLGNEAVAFESYLEPAEDLIIEYESKPNVSTSDLYPEKGYVKLEHGYYELSQNNYPEVRQLAEEIIRIYDRNEQRIEIRRKILYILGEAYNLLGIALQGDKGSNSKFGRNAEYCWQTAIKKLKEVKDPVSRYSMLNIEMNRALVQLDQGNCDNAIQILENTLYSTDPEYKLSNQQRLGVRYNLAAAYLDRLEDNDLYQARTLTDKNLNIATEHNNFDELVKTVELYGNIIKEEIKALIKKGQIQQVKPLVIEYENYFHSITQSRSFYLYEDWHAENDGLVIHRLLAEIYLLVKTTEKAKAELQHIEALEFSNTQQDQEELFLTRAVFEQSQKHYPKALFCLEHAKDLFSKAKRFGMVIEVNIRCAELSVEQGNWVEAKQHLTEALNLANDLRLACRNRIIRIKNMLKDVEEKEQSVSKKQVIRLFYSYSHKDEALRNKLETHLKLLERRGLIKQWHDRCITAGEEWKGQIDENLKCADIILLLISSNFLASNYCYEVEMTHALERHTNNLARVIPIIVRNVNWHAAPFAHLQVLPKDGKAVTTWSDRDSAWKNVAEGIEKVIEDLRSKQS